MFKVNNRSTRTRCEICSKLIIKTPERHLWCFFIVNFEHISHLVLMFLGLFFEQVNADYHFEGPKGNNGNTKTRCEICSKLAMKTSERRQN